MMKRTGAAAGACGRNGDRWLKQMLPQPWPRNFRGAALLYAKKGNRNVTEPATQNLSRHLGGTDEPPQRNRPDPVLEVKVYEPEAASQADRENQALINLLQSWREEDAADDPQELERRDAKTNALMSNLQASRLSLRGPEA